MTSPARDTAVYQRIAIVAHVLFLAAALLAFALVGVVNASVIALAVGALVFAGWTVYMLRIESAARHDEAMAATHSQRNRIDNRFASERNPTPPSVVPVPSSTGTTVVAAAPGAPPSNPIRPPAEPMGE